jgi:hypothetical protein
MQECLRTLEQAREYDSDTLLVAHVRVQHLMDRVARLRTPADDIDEVPVPRAPVSAYTSAFRSELDNLRANLPKSLRANSEFICTPTYIPPLFKTRHRCLHARVESFG